VHLERLTLRGFKSFASATSLNFEPGLTCVVGPNGSGKSNVVDAIAWVLGEQGAKALRGGTMSDVIFAGTPNRPPLGRAEVQLTIDNSDGALPIDYAEVTIGRLMFRSGESEYSINGTPCRLLDVQELMSDSGIGRELHVVVGQGQLDAVLGARPEDRRGFIEEAAGVLKHRKRKEKALRKLEAMQANLARVSDLNGELRRQLGPLGRQAEAARKAGAVQAAVRDARLRLLADDLQRAQAALTGQEEGQVSLGGRADQLDVQVQAVRAREAELAEAAERDDPALAAARELAGRLSQLRERVHAVLSLAQERGRHLAATQPTRTGPDPDELETQASQIEHEEAALASDLDQHRRALQETRGQREQVERALAVEETALNQAVRAAADRREGLARLTGQVESARTRAATRASEIDRLTATGSEAGSRAAAAEAELGQAETNLEQLDAGELGLDERHEAAAAVLDAAQQRLQELLDSEREAERTKSAAQARRDALAMSFAATSGTEAFSETLGVDLVPATADLTVRPGYEAAVAIGLGIAAESWAVPTVDSGRDLVDRLRAADAGRAAFLVTGLESLPAPGPAPAGTVWVRELLQVPATLAGAVDRLLDGIVALETSLAGPEDARRAVAAAVERGLRVVTPEGDVLSASLVTGGSPGARSLLELQSELESAERGYDDALQAGERLRFALVTARQQQSDAQEEVDRTLTELHESDARMSAVSERLAQLSAVAKSASAEAERTQSALTAAEQARAADLATVAELEQRLAAASAPIEEGERPTDERDRLRELLGATRAAEVDGQLAVRTAEERVRGLAGRAGTLRKSAQEERAARARAEARHLRRTAAAAVAVEVEQLAQRAAGQLSTALDTAEQERQQEQQSATSRTAELTRARDESRRLSDELSTLREQLHRSEVHQVEARLRLETLEATALEEFTLESAELISGFGPEVPVPAETEDGEPQPYERAVQEERLAKAERALARFGKINPLALEEYEALQERSTFLATQLTDLEATRRDLMHVVREVDERVQEAFRSAFEDTAREFEIVFATMFPGGTGRLYLTDPDDMLTTGIEVEARPAGKKVARLSLLSGGERSMAALALLLSIFRARPSPFYVLDEVEAALDDRNLGRLLEALAGLREHSQLVVITHQKRTMEIADALYGVTMRGDGVSTVISQRLRERATA
jgi:chromosome segregation protein